MNVAMECGGANPQIESLIEELDESMNEMIRGLVGPLYQWKRAVDRFHPGIAFPERSQIRIMLPQLGTSGPDIREKTARITSMQIAHRRRQHQDVAGREGVS